jgi:hypothetical protein
MSKIWDHPELARGKKIVTKGNKEVDQQNKLRTLKMVLLALADMANDDGVCWPSNKTIAERSNLTTDYVRSLMGTLKANGWLTTEERFSPTGKQTSNVITLNTAKINRISTPDLLHPSHLVGGAPLDLVGGIPPHLVGGTIEPSLYPPVESSKAASRPAGDDKDGRATLELLRAHPTLVYLDNDAKRLAMGLEQDFTLDQIRMALRQTADRHDAKIGTGDRGIMAPLSYARGILVKEGQPTKIEAETVQVSIPVNGSRGESYNQVVNMNKAKAIAAGYTIIGATS